MSPESQRIAIAEACGWKRTPEGAKSAWFNPAHRGHGRSMFRNRVPDYLVDLNAMNEAENTLSDKQRVRYAKILGNDPAFCALVKKNVRTRIELLISATAYQRAEAFLRTLGKWEVA